MQIVVFFQSEMPVASFIYWNMVYWHTLIWPVGQWYADDADTMDYRAFDSYVLLSNLKTHRPQYMYFDICRSKDENVKNFQMKLQLSVSRKQLFKMMVMI